MITDKEEIYKTLRKIIAEREKAEAKHLERREIELLEQRFVESLNFIRQKGKTMELKEYVKTASLKSLLSNHFKYSELAGQFYSDEDFETRGRCLEKSKIIRNEILRRFDRKDENDGSGKVD